MKLDLLYSFHFDGSDREDALKRFSASIKSIMGQDVRLCVSNTSQECIQGFLDEFKVPIAYVHKPTGKPCCKSLTINYGVKNLVESEYFFVSDIDLVYQEKYSEIMSGYIARYEKPIRVVPLTYNISYACYSPIFEDHMKDPGKRDGCGRGWKMFSHGNGLIHLESFMRIRGYDEEFVGHGPEDIFFNDRISKINQLIYTKDPEASSAHIKHKKPQKLGLERFRNDNIKFHNLKKKHVREKEAAEDLRLGDIIANKEREWGSI